MIMNSTVRPTRPMIASPTVRIALITPSNVSYSACLVRTRSTSSRAARAVLTSPDASGSARLISRLANSVIGESASPRSSSRPISRYDARRRSIASSGDT